MKIFEKENENQPESVISTKKWLARLKGAVGESTPSAYSGEYSEYAVTLEMNMYPSVDLI